METQPSYRIVFSGRLREGFEPDEVKRALATELQISPEKVMSLFSGERHVLKHVDSLEKATRYVKLFAKNGIVTTVDKSFRHGNNKQATNEPDEAVSTPLPRLKPLRTRWLFQPLLWVVALIEAGLTLIYVALLPVLLIALLYPDFLAAWLFEYIPSVILASGAYALIFLLGMVVLALLTKPLLAFHTFDYPTMPLSAEEEPDLYAFVEDICERIGSTPPTEILLSNDATLSVRYNEDLRAMLRGNTTLTLGLPLILSLNTRQSAAAVAQAMHGWGKGRAPRLCRLLELHYEWQQRTAYQADAIDRLLDRWVNSPERSGQLPRILQRLISLSRQPARLRQRLSRLLALRLWQRRETEADSAARHLAGNDDFRYMQEQSRVLAYAAQHTIPALNQMWQKKGELPDNIAMAVKAQASHYPAEIHAKLRRRQDQRHVSTHSLLSSDSQRLLWLDQQKESGNYQCSSPSATLLRRFNKLMHGMTMRYYHKHLGIPVTTNKLIRTPVKGSQEYEADSYIECYFGPLYADFVSLRTATRLKQGAVSQSEAVQHWQLSQSMIEAERAKAKAALTFFHQADDDLITVSNREMMQRAGFVAQLGNLSLLKKKMDEVHQTCRDYEAKYEAALNDAEQATAPYIGRISATLSLLASPQSEQRISDTEELRKEVTTLVSTFDKVELQYAMLRNLRLQTLLLESLLSHESRRAKRALRDLIIEKTDDVHRILAGLDVSLRNTRFPFADKHKYRNVMHWALETSLETGSSLAILDRGMDAVQQLALLQRLIIGRLTTISLQVEKSFGLKAAA